MALKEVQGIYQGILKTNLFEIGKVTEYLNQIKEGHKTDRGEKATYFYLENNGQVITQPEGAEIKLMCTGLSKEVAGKLEELVEKPQKIILKPDSVIL
ncbi:MAG: hypothetical protein ABIE36_00885 [Candidatus Diapherotrites archaeon]